MAALRFLIVSSLVVFTVAQQCDQAIQDFHQCMRDTFRSGRRPGQGQGQGPSSFDDIKQKADQCFTSNNCDPPKFGGPRGGPNGGQGGPGFGGPNGGQGGPGFGRGGPNGGQGGGPNGGQGGGQGNQVGGERPVPGGSGTNDRRQCFQTVGNKTREYILQCMRKADPSFTFPQGGHGGPGGPADGPGGHGFGRGFGRGFGGPGGPGGPGGDGPGGPGGPGGFRGGPPGGQQFLLQSCKNNVDAANKVNACLAGLFPKPDQAQMRKDFEDHCKAKKDCEAKLGTCKDAMDKRRQAMCNCGKEARGKRQEFQQQEPSCANVQNFSGGRGPFQGRERDCSEKPQDPCQQGFDAVMQQSQSRKP